MNNQPEIHFWDRSSVVKHENKFQSPVSVVLDRKINIKQCISFSKVYNR